MRIYKWEGSVGIYLVLYCDFAALNCCFRFNEWTLCILVLCCRYSGYVNDDHMPHGNGIMRYEDGTEYDGVWSEGSKVHGKTKSRSSKNDGGKSKF